VEGCRLYKGSERQQSIGRLLGGEDRGTEGRQLGRGELVTAYQTYSPDDHPPEPEPEFVPLPAQRQRERKGLDPFMVNPD
jgi:hypothetical protein